MPKNFLTKSVISFRQGHFLNDSANHSILNHNNIINIIYSGNHLASYGILDPKWTKTPEIDSVQALTIAPVKTHWNV